MLYKLQEKNEMSFHLKIEIRNSTAIGIAKRHHYKKLGFSEFYFILYEKQKKIRIYSNSILL